MSGQSIVRALPAILDGSPEERLAALFDGHHERLYRLARRLAPSVDDALDLVQETYLRAARSLHSIPAGTQTEEAWLVRVLINIRRDQCRKASRQKDQVGYYIPTSTDPEAALIAKAAVWQALDALPPRRRAIVVMHELEGLGVPAIAALLGITTITVRWHLSMGRRDLSSVLQSKKESAKKE